MEHWRWNTKTNSQSLQFAAIIGSIIIHIVLLLLLFCPLHIKGGAGAGSVNIEMLYEVTGSPAQTTSHQDKKIKPTPEKIKKNSEQNLQSHREAQDSSSSESTSRSSQTSGGGPGPKPTRWPRVMREKKVSYPTQAKRNGIQGEVSLKITIDEKGLPTNIQILSGPGQGLNEAAVEAIRGFIFSPAYVDDQPISVEILYKYKFQIEEK